MYLGLDLGTSGIKAMLIDDAWCDLFQRHAVQVGVSIDGPFVSAALEVLGKQEHLDRFRARRRRLDMQDLAEVMQVIERVFEGFGHGVQRSNTGYAYRVPSQMPGCNR